MDNEIICKLLNAFPLQSDYEALIQSPGIEEIEEWDLPEAYFI